MAKLSWGEPKVEIAPIDNGVIGSYTALPEIKQGTATLNTEAGEQTEALDEGGNVVDSRTAKSKYTFECDIFVKKGDECPVEDEDGIVKTNYAMRLTPEDPTCHGFMMPMTSVSVQESWSSADGSLWHLTFKGLKPKSGRTLQPYQAEVTD